jgi:hypothetical protein
LGNTSYEEIREIGGVEKPAPMQVNAPANNAAVEENVDQVWAASL